MKPRPNADSSEIGAPGFHVFRNAFTDVHTSLLSDVRKTSPNWKDYRFRLTKDYGPPYNLQKKRFLFGPNAPPKNGMPTYATQLVIPRIASLHPLLHDFQPNQMTAGLYQGNAHILPHNDCENGHIGTAVVGVCLGASCTMTLILRKKDSGMGHDVKRDVFLPAGAMYAMSGDALRKWHHAIFPGKTDGTRVSLTFRDVSPHAGVSLPTAKGDLATSNHSSTDGLCPKGEAQ